jgi:hypothetical protein
MRPTTHNQVPSRDLEVFTPHTTYNQQQQGWGDYSQQQLRQGHNYVHYDEYQSLVGHVEGVDQTLQDANNNINILTTDFHNYMTNFTATRTTRIRLLTTRDPS